MEKRERLMEGDGWYLDKCRFARSREYWKVCEDLAFLDHPQFKSNRDKVVTVHRCVGTFSDEAPCYYISKQADFSVQTKPLTPKLRELLSLVNRELDENFNLILVNQYAQNDSIGPHFDNYEYNGRHSVVTISFGATRVFQINSRERLDDPPIDFKVEDGDVFILSNGFQHLYLHGVPAHPFKCGKRVSLTFRRVHNPQPFVVPANIVKEELCVLCNLSKTSEKSHVCKECFQRKMFTCPECPKAVGAPNWTCNDCWLSNRLKRKYVLGSPTGSPSTTTSLTTSPTVSSTSPTSAPSLSSTTQLAVQTDGHNGKNRAEAACEGK